MEFLVATETNSKFPYVVQDTCRELRIAIPTVFTNVRYVHEIPRRDAGIPTVITTGTPEVCQARGYVIGETKPETVDRINYRRQARTCLVVCLVCV